MPCGSGFRVQGGESAGTIFERPPPPAPPLTLLQDPPPRPSSPPRSPFFACPHTQTLKPLAHPSLRAPTPKPSPPRSPFFECP